MSSNTHDQPRATITTTATTVTPAGSIEPLPLLTARQAAARLGVTAEALERWRGAGTGPAYIKLSGKYVRYRQEDLDQFVQASRRQSTAQA